MESKIRILLAFCIIFSIQYNVNALIGPNVRLANDNEVSFIVSFVKYDGVQVAPLQNHFCTGALVSRQHVLSSESCIRHRQKNETVLLAGTRLLTSGRLYRVLWWINYEEYANYRRGRPVHGVNDLSITKTYGPFHESIPTGFISPMTAAEFTGAEALLAGWGVTNNNQLSQVLLADTVHILPNDYCEDRITALEGRRSDIDIRYLCTAGNPYVLLAPGDFGGPLVFGNYIIGVNKETRPYRNTDFHPDKVNIHMNIEYFRSFIIQTTRDDFEWI